MKEGKGRNFRLEWRDMLGVLNFPAHSNESCMEVSVKYQNKSILYLVYFLWKSVPSVWKKKNTHSEQKYKLHQVFFCSHFSQGEYFYMRKSPNTLQSVHRSVNGYVCASLALTIHPPHRCGIPKRCPQRKATLNCTCTAAESGGMVRNTMWIKNKWLPQCSKSGIVHIEPFYCEPP